MRTPYEKKPNFQFHNRVMRAKHPSFFDPIVDTKFKISDNDQIMTIGSCFAQHLSNWLSIHTSNFLKNEDDIFGGRITFSGNYGNVYSVAQLLQLFDRAFGQYTPNMETWTNAGGRFFDPLRPSVMPNGLNEHTEVLDYRSSHEAKVKELFSTADVLVFTLGLTEMWVRSSDNAVLPLAPGVLAGSYDPNEVIFHNATFMEVTESLTNFIEKLYSVNPSCKILLTVSPVPLAATYEHRHVSVASMASKSILRAAVETVVQAHDHVDYFPSFEIFYTPGIGNGYFSSDMRHVLPEGVEHAMKIFQNHFLISNVGTTASSSRERDIIIQRLMKSYGAVVCDEDRI